jgi:hypothetical protein
MERERERERQIECVKSYVLPTHCLTFPTPPLSFHHPPRPGFHRVMTSLSKIYSRAKAANKGKAGSATATSPTASNSIAAETTALMPSIDSKKNLKSVTSIFQPTPSEDIRTRVGVGISDALASFTGKNTNSNASKNGGVTSIYFGNRSQADQYLTAKPKLPSRISSDPIRVFKQADGEEEEHKGKTWSNDILPKAVKSWPASSDKSTASGSSAAGDSEKSVRLYDFSSTPTGVSAPSGESVGKRSPPKNNRHSIGPESPPPGSSVGSVKSVTSSAAGGRKSTSPGSMGGGGGGGGKGRATAAGQIDDNQLDDKQPFGGLFQVLNCTAHCLLSTTFCAPTLLSQVQHSTCIILYGPCGADSTTLIVLYRTALSSVTLFRLPFPPFLIPPSFLSLHPSRIPPFIPSLSPG